MNNNNNKTDELLRRLLEELQDMEELSSIQTDYDEGLAFELEILSRGARTKPVFYD